MTWSPPALLTHSVASCSLDIPPIQYQSVDGQGRAYGVQAGIPLWTLSIGLTGTNPAKFRDWEAWINRLRRAQRPFIGRDLLRGRPRAYNNHAGFPNGFGGQCGAWSQSVDGDGTATLSLGGLPVGLILSVGDPVDFRWANAGAARRSLHRMMTASIANGSGVATMEIEPPIQDAGAIAPIVPANAVPHLDDAGCIMRLTDGTKIGEVSATDKFPSISLVAAQDLRP